MSNILRPYYAIVIAFGLSVVLLSGYGCNNQSSSAPQPYPDSSEIAKLYTRTNQYYAAHTTDSFFQTIKKIRSKCKYETQYPALMDYYKYQVIGNMVLTSNDSLARLYVDSALRLGVNPIGSGSSYVAHYIAGLYHLVNKDYAKAAPQFIQSIQQQINNERRAIDSSIYLSCYANLAEIYFFQKNYQQAFNAYQPLFQHALKQQDSVKLINVYQNMSLYKFSAGDTIACFRNLKMAERICINLKDTIGLVSIYGRYIYYFTANQFLDSAIYYGAKVTPVIENRSDLFQDCGDIYINLAQVYASKGNIKKASTLFDKAKAIFWTQARNSDDSFTYYQTLAAVRTLQNRHKEANEAKDILIAIADQISKKEKDEQLLKFEESIKKAGAEKTIAVKDHQLERQRTLSIALTVITLLLLLMAAAIYFSLKRKRAIEILQSKNEQKVAELENEKRIVKLQAAERERIAQEMHDDVGSTLSALNMAVSSLEKETDAPHAKMAGGFAQKLSVKMNEIIWDLNTMNDNAASLIAYLRRFSKTFLEQAGIALDFVAMNEEGNVPVNGHTRRNVYLFTKELLNNTVKYAQATKVNVRLEIKEHHVVLHISDNGTGFDFSKQKFEGNGLRGIIKRVEDLNGFIDFDTEQGTTVVIRLPI